MYDITSNKRMLKKQKIEVNAALLCEGEPCRQIRIWNRKELNGRGRKAHSLLCRKIRNLFCLTLDKIISH